MTAASSWTTTALLRGLAIATVFSCTVTAMPSFGLRIPNGERVPCSSSTSEEMAAGCSRQGYCLGLGHHQCDGVQPDDVTLESTTEETRLVSLNPFGDDFKTANYEWYMVFIFSFLVLCINLVLCFDSDPLPLLTVSLSAFLRILISTFLYSSPFLSLFLLSCSSIY